MVGRYTDHHLIFGQHRERRNLCYFFVGHQQGWQAIEELVANIRYMLFHLFFSRITTSGSSEQISARNGQVLNYLALKRLQLVSG